MTYDGWKTATPPMYEEDTPEPVPSANDLWGASTSLVFEVLDAEGVNADGAMIRQAFHGGPWIFVSDDTEPCFITSVQAKQLMEGEGTGSLREVPSSCPLCHEVMPILLARGDCGCSIPDHMRSPSDFNAREQLKKLKGALS